MPHSKHPVPKGPPESSACGTVAPALRVVVRTGQPSAGAGRAESAYPGLLSEAERERAARFRFERDRASYCATHALLRAMLAELHGLPPLHWRFVVGPHGRPEVDPAVAGPAGVRFNLSHTEGLAACAVAVGGLPAGFELGVDAEREDRSLAALDLAERFFSPREVAALKALPEAAQRRGFMRLWTLKEAVAKATGLGLAIDLRSFHCRTDPPAVEFENPDLSPAAAWVLRHWPVPPRHLLSLAVRRPPGVPVAVELSHLGVYEG